MPKPYIVASPQQLMVIASPGRDALIDSVDVIGPCTVTELARFTGQSRNALYYHINALRDCGLLIETRRSGEGKKTTAYYDVPGRPMIVRFNLSTPRTRRAVTALGRARLRTAARGFTRACQSARAVVDGPARNLWASSRTGWLSKQELTEANGLLRRLVDLFGNGEQSGSADRALHELTFVVAPVLGRR
jgi:DNA-binding transcriptional ArsR family regulator